MREREDRETGMGNRYLVLALLQTSWSRPWWTVTVAVVREAVAAAVLPVSLALTLDR